MYSASSDAGSNDSEAVRCRFTDLRGSVGGECEVSLLVSDDAAAEHRLFISVSMSTSSFPQLDVAGDASAPSYES